MQTSQSPSADLVAVTPHDTNPIVAAINGKKNTTRGVYVGTTGDLTVITPKGQTVEFVAVPAGTLLPIMVTHVTTASTASDIVALF